MLLKSRRVPKRSALILKWLKYFEIGQFTMKATIISGSWHIVFIIFLLLYGRYYIILRSSIKRIWLCNIPPNRAERICNLFERRIYIFLLLLLLLLLLPLFLETAKSSTSRESKSSTAWKQQERIWIHGCLYKPINQGNRSNCSEVYIKRIQVISSRKTFGLGLDQRVTQNLTIFEKTDLSP